MHPPFFTTDHRSVVHTPHLTHSHKNGLRRTRPDVLSVKLGHQSAHAYIPSYLVSDIITDEKTTKQPVILTVVPDPSHGSLRDIVGRWLIRVGQRLILQNHPG